MVCLVLVLAMCLCFSQGCLICFPCTCHGTKAVCSLDEDPYHMMKTCQQEITVLVVQQDYDTASITRVFPRLEKIYRMGGKMIWSRKDDDVRQPLLKDAPSTKNDVWEEDTPVQVRQFFLSVIKTFLYNNL